MIRKVLVVGGGIGGMTAAIALKRNGVDVDLIDADPEWRVYGAGISVTGISLRAFDALGIFDEIKEVEGQRRLHSCSCPAVKPCIRSNVPSRLTAIDAGLKGSPCPLRP